MDDFLGFVIENWASIAAAIGGLITVLGLIADLTPWKWDNQAVKVARKIWAMIRVTFGSSKRAEDMGSRKPNV